MKELPKKYDAKVYEDTLYAMWEKSGYFNPDVCLRDKIADEKSDYFSIVLPPPNVTGTLHLGHATMLAIEDTLVRFNRMQGKRTLWVPGTDSAALATQEKVEKLLWESEQKTRDDLGREAFLRRVDDFASESHDTIINQCKKMGASMDWDREAFTLDETRTLAVNTAFKMMYEDGIIYRGGRIVNWDPKMQTTVSDDELEYKEEKTKFYYLKYGPFTIGTARPETKFGDKYVVMHPDDKRFAQYTHGQEIELEWISGMITATVIKDEAAQMDFGTGVMTITPWHDATDFDIAQRHDLDREQIIGDDGKLLDVAGDFAEMPISEAREAIIKHLDEKGLVEKIDEEYVHNISTNSRGGGIIEPQIKEQWFIDVNKEFERDGKTWTLKALMLDAVRDKQIDILPERFEKIYFHWIENLRDWCISRQIWYGHRIPIWYRNVGGKQEVCCDLTAPEGDGWEQDPDTLDTWFSSGLWTMSTLGWNGDDTNPPQDLQNYHPTSVIETGYDIIFFWVARMILMSRYLMPHQEIPFKTVYLHGLVRDEHGKKMSKSLGNIINPLDVSDKYGTDAVRLALMIGTTPGQDVKLSEKKIESYRNFTTKLWNIGRYISVTVPEHKQLNPADFSEADHWILHELNTLITSVTDDLEHYRLSPAGEALRDFTWNSFAKWYVEYHKFGKNDAVLLHVFEVLLKLWHPFMPFVTEQLWQDMYPHKNLLMVAAWPKIVKVDGESALHFSSLTQAISQINSLRALNGSVGIKTASVFFVSMFTDDMRHFASRLCNTSVTYGELQSYHATVKSTLYQVWVDFGDDFNKATMISKLTKEKDKLEQFIVNTDKRLANEKFVAGAPQEVIAAQRASREEAVEKVSTLSETLDSFS